MANKKTVLLNGKTYVEFRIEANLTNLTSRTFYKSQDGKSVIYQNNNENTFRHKNNGSAVRVLPGAGRPSAKKDR